MDKSSAVASLGQQADAGMGALLQPTQLKAALAANDRLKLYLTVLQAAVAHAQRPGSGAPDLAREIAAAGITDREAADWLRDLPDSASVDGEAVSVPELPRLCAALGADLSTMARPLTAGAGADAALAARVQHWAAFLAGIGGPTLDARTLEALTRGQRKQGDSLHVTLMDLHRALNQRAATLATESVAGAQTWQLAADGSDHARVEAFMRGLNRTRALKGDHPGLDSAATRDGARLLIQNDIGTNDAHVLVIQVARDDGGRMVTTLTYSDLHRQRFAFFQQLLAELGASWGEIGERRTRGLNAGDAYHLGSATLVAEDDTALAAQLEGIGERIVFLIDWNRARKRLLPFVGKAGAVQVLTLAAQRRAGHMAWLAAGGERLVWNAMAAQGGGSFRLGDRLDEVLGDDPARDFLVEVLVLAARASERRQPAALVEDEVRALLARRLHLRRGEFELLQEHAALCHALAQALAEAFALGHERRPAPAARLAARAKAWERQADQLVVRARAQAERQPQWRPMAQLVERSDDVADALEEACFVFSLLAEHFGADGVAEPGFGRDARSVMAALADAVLAAAQDHVKALTVAGTLGDASEARDHDEFLAASWRVLQAERQCDELLRGARRALAADARRRGDAVALALGNELAAAIEHASDALLALGYGVRGRVFRRIEAQSS